MTPIKALQIIKAEMDALRREKPNLPKSQMRRLGLRFDWNIVNEALANTPTITLTTPEGRILEARELKCRSCGCYRCAAWCGAEEYA